MILNGTLAAKAADMQQTILAALEIDPGVTIRLGSPPRIHDDVPADPVYPYMTFGSVRSEDTSGDAAPQTTHQISLHIWSRYTGRSEVLELMERVEHAIRGVPVFTIVPLYLDVFRAPDGRTRHGLLRLSITIPE